MGKQTVKKREQEIKEMEERDAAGYSRVPAEANDIDEWKDEQVWTEDEKFAQHDAASQHKVTTSGGTKVMEKSLKRAAEIRDQLEGRRHSDSTKLVAEDRGVGGSPGISQ